MKIEIKDYNGCQLSIEPFGNNALLVVNNQTFVVNKSSANELQEFLNHWFEMNKKIK